MKKAAKKRKPKAKRKMTVLRAPAYVGGIAQGIADFTGVPIEDVIKVIFALGLAWGELAAKRGAESG
jgi:hypothetical protein